MFRTRTAALAVLLAAGGVLAAAGAASAHVTVHPESYAQGATDGLLTFRVPNEDDKASTSQVQVFLPTDHPLLGVLVRSQDGWTPKVTTAKLKTPVKTDDGTITDAVSEITWTGGKIAPGQFEDFDVAFGQLPEDAAKLEFKTLQTYDSGKVVRWIEAAGQGDDDPENPAPVLTLTSGKPAAAPVAKSAADHDSTARELGIGGLALGAVALGAGGFAVARARSPRS
ncbi:YcnI family protein [Streptomyces acidiscabies]|uniref:Membrane protein n=1 Tax=Streptomyces acidiscabies TaxID=42234 RepID=A0A0L0JG95_9ACTN|nr:YcnI family protein [Streptomyces acidiscabies]MBP5935704.1 YcnI family protein [Streptomyces sp. LBUM 1476]KND24691.1 membrane protein [Streptomyces acidiscabies]MBZ3916403.1 YcnI family protein [Streptomyces acidiscabies]MDX2961224.1 YcnI family protein [Streptomyces acidiscabies]MDX3022822.1 YcnI family protein [Streptomyces acidiscabies]